MNELSIIFQSEAFQVGETLSSTFGMIKSTLEGNFEFLHPVSQLVENLKPTKKMFGQLFIFIYILYLGIVFNVSWNQKSKRDK